MNGAEGFNGAQGYSINGSAGFNGDIVGGVESIYLISFGDSREDAKSGVATPDLNAGVAYSQRSGYTNQAGTPSVALHIKDAQYIGNFGASGEEIANWDNAARANGKTMAALYAMAAGKSKVVVIIQGGTNDDQLNVNSEATRDSIAARIIGDCKALITNILTTTSNIRIVYQTQMQRTAAGYVASTVERRDCCDIVNTEMVSWIPAHADYQTRLRLADLRAATNVGGALTGAYLDDSTGMLDSAGVHLNFLGNLEIMRIVATEVRAFFPEVAIQEMVGCEGQPNLITSVSAASLLRNIKTNCTGSSITYGTDADGYDYAEQAITITGAGARSTMEFYADVGTSGGHTPANTFAVGDKIQGRARITVHDGSGGVPTVVGDVFAYWFTSYIGGTPGLQTQQNGSAITTGMVQLVGEFNDKQHTIPPLTMTGDSSLIALPTAGQGMRIQFGVYAQEGVSSGTYTFRITNPELRKRNP